MNSVEKRARLPVPLLRFEGEHRKESIARQIGKVQRKYERVCLTTKNLAFSGSLANRSDSRLGLRSILAVASANSPTAGAVARGKKRPCQGLPLIGTVDTFRHPLHSRQSRETGVVPGPIKDVKSL